MKKCIVNGKVILHDEIVEKNVFIDGDKIMEISDRQPTEEEIIDAKGAYFKYDFKSNFKNRSDIFFTNNNDNAS